VRGTHAAVLVAFLLGAAAAAQPACAPWPAAAGGPALDLAPPPGYAEVCSQDAALCHRLTAGYPPSVLTLGYFVPVDEWAAFRRGETLGFRQYLIAQLATATAPDDLPGLKARLRAQQGDAPDHTQLPAVFESAGRATLGIFDETDRSVSFGVVMRLRPAGATPGVPELTLVATNTLLALGDRVLSLYVYREYGGPPDVAAAERLTREWLACLTTGR
jgi:hypothetical protein